MYRSLLPPIAQPKPEQRNLRATFAPKVQTKEKIETKPKQISKSSSSKERVKFSVSPVPSFSKVVDAVVSKEEKLQV